MTFRDFLVLYILAVVDFWHSGLKSDVQLMEAEWRKGWPGGGSVKTHDRFAACTANRNSSLTYIPGCSCWWLAPESSLQVPRRRLLQERRIYCLNEVGAGGVPGSSVSGNQICGYDVMWRQTSAA